MNAHSRLTRLGGSVLAPHVLEAMAWAAGRYFDMHELHAKVGERLAALTRNEAVCVTSGAAAGLVLAAAACIAGRDPAKAAKLPQPGEGVKNEIVVHRFQRNHYDNNVRTAGARLVEIGQHRATQSWELEDAIGPSTAAVLYFAGPYEGQNLLPLAEVLRIAKARQVPLIVDAAAQIPPAANLWNFTRMGADLVLFSGGKGLGGPQNTGIIAGRKELVHACTLLASPNHAIGRPMKVGKEGLVGLLAAVEFYLERGEKEQRERCERIAAFLVERLADTQGLRASRRSPNFKRQPLPEVVVAFDEGRPGFTRDDIVRRLAAGVPRIAVALEGSSGIVINPDTLREEDAEVLVARVRATVGAP